MVCLQSIVIVLVLSSACYGQSSLWSFLGCRYITRQDCYLYGHNPECGTDGVTYRNRCDLSKKTCDSKDVHLAHYGACTSTDNNMTTASQVTAGTGNTMVAGTGSTAMAGTGSTPMTGTGSTAVAGNTSPVVAGTTMPTTQGIQTTNKPLLTGEEAALDFFCLLLSHDACPPEDDPICGSNNVTYKNSCEFEKDRCVYRDLHLVDFAPCS